MIYKIELDTVYDPICFFYDNVDDAVLMMMEILNHSNYKPVLKIEEEEND